MADRYEFDQLLKDLENPELFVKIPERTIFDEHKERFFVNSKTRKPCGEDDEDAEEVVLNFSRKKLEDIAERCNKRDAGGTLAPLAIGHTVPGEPDETKQPIGIGFGKNYKVKFDKRLNRYALKTDFYVRKEEYDEAKTFPRVSIELWKSRGDIDPICLIRRTPRRDIGQWIYSNDSQDAVFRYSMEFNMTAPTRYADDDDLFEEENEETPAEESSEKKGPGETPRPADPDDMTDDEIENHRREHYGRYMRCMQKRYAMQPGMPAGGEAMDAGAAVTPPAPDPTEDPSATEPVQNMAAASGTNGVIPGAKKKKDDVMQNGREDFDAIRFRRMEATVAEYKKHLEEAKARESKAEARRIVAQLLAEGYSLNEEKEVERFARLDEAGRKERQDDIREYHTRDIVAAQYSQPVSTGHRGRVPADATVDGTVDGSDDNGHVNDIRSLDRALQYAREHPGMSWDECVSKSKNGR